MNDDVKLTYREFQFALVLCLVFGAVVGVLIGFELEKAYVVIRAVLLDLEAHRERLAGLALIVGILAAIIVYVWRKIF